MRTLFFTVATCLLFFSEAGADETGRRLRKEIEPRLNSQSGLYVVDGDSGAAIYQYNADTLLKPASVLKILTTAAALKALGPEYTYRTEVLSSGSSTKPDRLIVRGGGDPSLRIEEAVVMARAIRARGIRHIGTLVVDTSRFENPRVRSGVRAYETGSSALSFNFNSTALTVCPSAAGSAARVMVEPWEISAVVKGRIDTVRGSRPVFSVEDSGGCDAAGCRYGYQVSGDIGELAPCETVYRSVEDPARYFGATFAALLRENGVGVGNVKFGSVSDGTETLLFTHASKPLRAILQDLNHYSSNFIAEQVVFALGARDTGSFSREAGLRRLLDELKLSRADGVVMMDGSGLSHDNRASARILLEVFAAAARDPATGVEFRASFPFWGRSGTLKRRGETGDGLVVRGKTGSLDGVSSLAGEVSAQDGRTFLFCLIQNGVANKAEAVKIEDELIQVLSSSNT